MILYAILFTQNGFSNSIRKAVIPALTPADVDAIEERLARRGTAADPLFRPD
jgi:hypothetical protein